MVSEMKKNRIIAAGHICIDIAPIFAEGKGNDITKILMPGKLVEVDAADIHTGGSVANTGLAMKKLGADVSLMGKVGDDEFGRMILGILDQYKAMDGMITDKESSTSYSVVLAIPGIDRIFLHNPGANNTFRASDVSPKTLEDAALFHFGYPPLMRTMYENNGEQLVSLMQSVRAAGVATSLDMAAVDPDTEAGKLDWNEVLKRVLPHVDFFVPSVEELCFMLDKERFSQWQLCAGGKDITEILDIEKDVKPLAEICMSYGVKVLLIKCGTPGMYYKTANTETLRTISSRVGLDADAWADKEGFEASYVPDCILSGTGAGDTSIAAFLASVINGETPETAMQLATATGACCVTSYDALGGLKPLDQLKEKINAGWQKNGI